MGYGQILSRITADLSECLCSLLETEGAGKTCWCGVYPGAEVAWDYCGECSGTTCGMGYVRVTSVFPYETFPNPASTGKCRTPLAATIVIGALRCLPTMEEDGTLPSPEALLESALGQFADMAAMHKAIDCCLKDYSIASYSPLGPGGGCVGGEWTVTVDLDG